MVVWTRRPETRTLIGRVGQPQLHQRRFIDGHGSRRVRSILLTPGRGVVHDVRMLQGPGRASRTVAVAALVLAASGCGGGSASTSSGDAERDARVVLQADLRPAATGRTAARLAQKFIELEGGAGTHGDAGQHVWVYSTPDATDSEVSGVVAAMQAEPSVVRVEKNR